MNMMITDAMNKFHGITMMLQKYDNNYVMNIDYGYVIRMIMFHDYDYDYVI